LAHALNDAIAMLDADLQDPPELLAECLAKWRDSARVVYAVRTRRKEVWKRFCYASFHRLPWLSAVDMPLDSAILPIDRRVARSSRHAGTECISSRPALWCGFGRSGWNTSAERGRRAVSIASLVSVSQRRRFSFSTFPLRLSIYMGLLVVIACLGMGLFIARLAHRRIQVLGHSPRKLPGWAGTIILLFLGGVQLTQLGLQGEYIARIYESEAPSATDRGRVWATHRARMLPRA
jgi:dolichol-phosphate mannosyltransferase